MMQKLHASTYILEFSKTKKNCLIKIEWKEQKYLDWQYSLNYAKGNGTLRPHKTMPQLCSGTLQINTYSKSSPSSSSPCSMNMKRMN